VENPHSGSVLDRIMHDKARLQWKSYLSIPYHYLAIFTPKLSRPGISSPSKYRDLNDSSDKIKDCWDPPWWEYRPLEPIKIFLDTLRQNR